MLSLTSKTLYDDIVDSGLKLVEDNTNDDIHDYTVELGYREGSSLNIEQINFMEDQSTNNSQALVEGSDSGLNAVIDRLDEDYELKVEEDDQYITY